jgi:hypothetical protein
MVHCHCRGHGSPTARGVPLTVSKRDKETRFNWNGNNARNRVAQVKRWSKDVSGFSTASYEFFRLVRNEEAGGSNPLSSTIFSNLFSMICAS